VLLSGGVSVYKVEGDEFSNGTAHGIDIGKKVVNAVPSCDLHISACVQQRRDERALELMDCFGQ
jgi:hypothetical protein